MIILVQPMYSKQELNADSNYVVYTQWIQAIHKIRPDWHFVVIFPDSKSGYKYQDDGFFSLPYVTRIPQRISPRKMSNAVTFDGMWYDKLFRQYGFDVVWCNLVEIAGQIAYAGQGVWQGTDLKVRPLVVSAHNYVIHESLQGNAGQRHILWAQMLGAYHSDINVYNTEYTRWMMMDNCEKYLSQESVDWISNKTKMIRYAPLNRDEFPQNVCGSTYSTSENEKSQNVCGSDYSTSSALPIIAYNHRLQGYKRYRDTFRILQELWDEGLRFKVRYMNNTSEHISHIKPHPFVETRLCANRTEYLEALGGCHLNVTNSSYETFCISAIESMAFGQPLVAPNGITFPEITGHADNEYPFLFNSEDEQKDMLRKLLTDNALRTKWGEVARKHVMDNYCWDNWARDYVDLFESESNIVYKTAGAALDLIKVGIESCHGKTTRELFNHVAGQTINGKVPFANQSLPMAKLIRLVRKCGGRIRMVSGKQIVLSS